jgi:hypothetical protein
MSKKVYEAVEKALGEPVGLEFSEPATKVRRNLMAASLVAIILQYAGATIASDTTILGVHFLGLNDDVVKTGLALTVVYFTFHFLWYALESFMEWRLRITGTRVAFITGATWGNELKDNPDNPRQSTLYNWWLFQSKRVQDIPAELKRVEQLFVPAIDHVRQHVDNPQPNNLANVMGQLSDALHQLHKIEVKTEKLIAVMSSERIPGSLQRFDRWFGLFLRVGNLRWLLIEALLPLSLSVIALIFLIA